METLKCMYKQNFAQLCDPFLLTKQMNMKLDQDPSTPIHVDSTLVVAEAVHGQFNMIFTVFDFHGLYIMVVA